MPIGSKPLPSRSLLSPELHHVTPDLIALIKKTNANGSEHCKTKREKNSDKSKFNFFFFFRQSDLGEVFENGGRIYQLIERVYQTTLHHGSNIN